MALKGRKKKEPKKFDWLTFKVYIIIR